jgi:hypothetical protein
MSEKIYHILKAGWEYNDEFYYRSESGSGTLEDKSYRDIEIAKKEKEKLEIKNFKSTDIAMYLYEEEIHMNQKELEKLKTFLPDHLKNSISLDEYGMIESEFLFDGGYDPFPKSEMNDEEILWILDLFEINFYELVTTEL